MRVLNIAEVESIGGGDDWWRYDPNMGANTMDNFMTCVGNQLRAQIAAGAADPSLFGAALSCWLR